jgi:nicotinamidase-related amidase
VRASVIDAYQLDYLVILADGCFDSHDGEHHAVSQRYMHGKLAEVLTLDTILTLLERSPR